MATEEEFKKENKKKKKNGPVSTPRVCLSSSFAASISFFLPLPLSFPHLSLPPARSSSAFLYAIRPPGNRNTGHVHTHAHTEGKKVGNLFRHALS